MDVGELARGVAGAPLVVRVREFLDWVGDRRRISRERGADAPRGRAHVYLSLGAWAGSEDVAGERPDREFPDSVGLLEFVLAARMLEMVVDRRDRTANGCVREHGWVLPGPAYPDLPGDSARVWRTAVELLPVLWRGGARARDRLPQAVPWRSLERLRAAGPQGVPVRALAAEAQRAGLAPAGFATVATLLEALALVRLDYVLDGGERCLITPLGRHAVALAPKDA